MNIKAYWECLVLVAYSVDAMQIGRRYKRFMNEIPTGNVTYQTTVQTRSKIECAGKCSENAKCYVFSFEKTTKVCSMLSAYVHLGYQNLYYDASEVHCPVEIGYTYEKQLNLCVRFEGGTNLNKSGCEEKCGAEGAHLVVIENSEVNQFLFDEIYKQGLYANGDFFFIDGSDEEEEGTWKSYTGDVMTYTNWYMGQPNADNEPNGETKENCAAFHYGFDGKWVDVDCDKSLNGYICQIDMKYTKV